MTEVALSRGAPKPKPPAGYACRSCGGQEKARPRLYVSTRAAFSGASAGGMLDVAVFLHDERVKDAELQDGRRNLEEAAEVDLLESYQGSKVHVRLRLPKDSWLQHSLDDRGLPLLAVEKSFDFHRLLTCRKCKLKEKQVPLTHRWLLQPAGRHSQPDPCFHGAVDVSHLSCGQDLPAWEASWNFLERVTSVVFVVECPPTLRKHEDRSAWDKQLQCLNDSQLEQVARALGIPEAQILSLKQRYPCSEDLRDQFQELCMTEGTTRTGLFIPVIAALVSDASSPRRSGSLHRGSGTDVSSGISDLPFAVNQVESDANPGGYVPAREGLKTSEKDRPVQSLDGDPRQNQLSVVPLVAVTQGCEYRDSGYTPCTPETNIVARREPVELTESVQMSCLKSLEETGTDHLSSYHLYNSASIPTRWNLLGNSESLPDVYETAAVVSTDGNGETGLPCRESEGARFHDFFIDAALQCNLVGNADSPQADLPNPQDTQFPREVNTVAPCQDSGTDGVKKSWDGTDSPDSLSIHPVHQADLTDEWPSLHTPDSSWEKISLGEDQVPVYTMYGPTQHSNIRGSSPQDSTTYEQPPSGANLSCSTAGGPSSPCPPGVSERGESPVTHLGQLERRGAQTVVNNLNASTSMISSSHSSASSSVCMEFTISLSDTDEASEGSECISRLLHEKKQSLAELLMKTSETLRENLMVVSGTAATQTEVQERPVPPPIVCSEWHLSSEFTSEGGSLQREMSDVVLHVPPGAVQSGESVEVVAAVCANVNRIRSVLQLSEHEEILSPLAEYSAGNAFRFQRPVFITLPHALPAGYDATQVTVYRVSHTDEGRVVVTKLCHMENQSDHGHGQPFSSDSQPSSAPPSFFFSSPGQLCVRTDCFSGYVCAYRNCGLEQESPVLRAMVCSSHSKDEDGQQVIIYTYVWDDRLNIKDFQEESGIGKTKEIQTRSVLPLMEDLDSSKLCFCLQLIGKGAKNWVHMRSPEAAADDPFPFQQSVDLQRVLSCSNGDCQARKVCSQPVAVVWALESSEECPPQASLTLRCAVLASHVPSATRLSECFQAKEHVEKLFVQVKEGRGGGAQSDSSRGQTTRGTKPMRQASKRQRINRPRQDSRSHGLNGGEDSSWSDDSAGRVKGATQDEIINMESHHEEKSSSATEKLVDWWWANRNNRHDVTKRNGRLNTCEYSESSCSSLQKAKLAKSTQRTILGAAPTARRGNGGVGDITKRPQKILIEDGASSSEDQPAFNPYSSSSETDVKRAVEEGKLCDGKDGDGDTALSDNHYEDVAPPPPACIHLPPSLPDRPATAAAPSGSGLSRAQSLPYARRPASRAPPDHPPPCPQRRADDVQEDDPPAGSALPNGNAGSASARRRSVPQSGAKRHAAGGRNRPVKGLGSERDNPHTNAKCALM